jgi:phospholipid transport system transporter-binding protein
VTDDRIVARDDGVLEVSGRLTFQTVPDILAQAAPTLSRAGSAVTVDMRRVEAVDTAGIALMLEWLGQARAQQRTLTFINISSQARHLIGASGLNKAFGFA